MAASNRKNEDTNVVTLMLENKDNDDDIVGHSYSALAANNGKASVVDLVHPHAGEKQHFIRSQQGALYEMQSIARPYGSFFVGSRVIASSSLHVLTPIDPLFFVLHALTANSENEQQENHQYRWQPLDQLQVPQIVQDALVSNEQLQHLCAVQTLDHNDDNDKQDALALYKFKDDKALKWLVHKQKAAFAIVSKQSLVEKRKNTLATQELLTNDGGAFSNSFKHADDDEKVKESNNTNRSKTTSTLSTSCTTIPIVCSTDDALSNTERAAAKEASLQIICDYLSPVWQTKLRQHLNMPMVSTSTAANDADSTRTAVSAADSEDNDKKRSRSSWEVTANNPGQDDADQLLQFTMGASKNGEYDDDTAAAAKKRKEAAKSAGLKRLAKVNTKGMKSLSNFFAAKKKTTVAKSN